tara:strand:- start:2604 stop:2762 length:159 start_codon:yes stop_codon:yes gene_type:complete
MDSCDVGRCRGIDLKGASGSDLMITDQQPWVEGIHYYAASLWQARNMNKLGA